MVSVRINLSLFNFHILFNQSSSCIESFIITIAASHQNILECERTFKIQRDIVSIEIYDTTDAKIRKEISFRNRHTTYLVYSD